MKRALIYTSVASMIEQFNMENIKLLNRLGYKVEVACNFKTGSTISHKRIDKLINTLEKKQVKTHHIPIPRNVTNVKDIILSFKQTRKLIKQKNYELVHCHSPIGGVIVRVANSSIRNNTTRMIYTAHGFHFHNTAPLKNWIVYYPIEKVLSRFTDTLITINREDYARAKKSFHSRKIEYIPGVGIDIEKMKNIKVNKIEYRKKLNIPEKAFLILSVGELNDNKNHRVIIEAISKIKRKDIYYVICGIGPLKKNLKDLASKYGLKDNVKLLGYREDVIEICKTSDMFAFPSKREGLGLAALEAMAAGLPLITSNVHGIVDYSVNDKTGYAVEPHDVDLFKYYIEKLYHNHTLRRTISTYNQEYVKKFDINNVNKQMEVIYSK